MESNECSHGVIGLGEEDQGWMGPKVCRSVSEDGSNWGEARGDGPREMGLFQTGFPIMHLEVPLVSAGSQKVSWVTPGWQRIETRLLAAM